MFFSSVLDSHLVDEEIGYEWASKSSSASYVTIKCKLRAHQEEKEEDECPKHASGLVFVDTILAKT